MNVPTLLVENVSKRYATYGSELWRFATWFGIPATPVREFWALRGISFVLGKGESLGIIGNNGAGKSSLLKIVAGTMMPTSGRIELNGSAAAILELGLNFDPELTGRENVDFHCHLLGLTPSEIRYFGPSIRDFADIGDAYDEPMRTYSTGMQARVAFAAATARRPDLLVIDEVLSVGDGHFQKKSFNRILECRAEGTSIVFVSHGIEGVEEVCERAIWLERGRVALAGSAGEVCAAYRQAMDFASSQTVASAEA